MALYDVAGLWSAAHAWAGKHGYETAIPTFEAGNSADGPVFGMITFDQGLPWLRADSMPCSEAYEQPPPGFSEAGAVVRNVSRWASTTGAARWGRAVLTGWPSFQVPLEREPVTHALPSATTAQEVGASPLQASSGKRTLTCSTVTTPGT